MYGVDRGSKSPPIPTISKGIRGNAHTQPIRGGGHSTSMSPPFKSISVYIYVIIFKCL